MTKKLKILVAGATGAIGHPLLLQLNDGNYEVYGITHNPLHAEGIENAGATPLFLDVLNEKDVLSTFEDIRPDIVIDMLTHLPKDYKPSAMKDAIEIDTKIKLEGGRLLLQAAEKYGTKRYIAQSSAFWYKQGTGLADESVGFATSATPAIAVGSMVYSTIEERTLNSQDLEGVVLRFGFFYGPGTWFYPNESVATQLQNQEYPLIGKGEGIWSFVHVEDAAIAIKAALNANPGIYNIVDDKPTSVNNWLPAFADYVDAPRPLRITEESALTLAGADAVYYATKLRGASNEKAKATLDFKPRNLEWL